MIQIVEDTGLSSIDHDSIVYKIATGSCFQRKTNVVITWSSKRKNTTSFLLGIFGKSTYY